MQEKSKKLIAPRKNLRCKLEAPLIFEQLHREKFELFILRCNGVIDYYLKIDYKMTFQTELFILQECQ